MWRKNSSCDYCNKLLLVGRATNLLMHASSRRLISTFSASSHRRTFPGVVRGNGNIKSLAELSVAWLALTTNCCFVSAKLSSHFFQWTYDTVASNFHLSRHLTRLTSFQIALPRHSRVRGNVLIDVGRLHNVKTGLFTAPDMLTRLQYYNFSLNPGSSTVVWADVRWHYVKRCQRFLRSSERRFISVEKLTSVLFIFIYLFYFYFFASFLLSLILHLS
jgi:hypothetical protein